MKYDVIIDIIVEKIFVHSARSFCILLVHV